MKSKGSGAFITIEGGEGAGKSTLIRGLAERLSASGFSVVQTREPGGSTGAEAIREFVLTTSKALEIDSLAEALLIYAARADHLANTIRPAMERGEIVLCDRFHDSTHAYQGAGRGIDHSWLKQLDDLVIGTTFPMLTIVLDVDVALGAERTKTRREDGKASALSTRENTASSDKQLDRFEKLSSEFHQRVRGYFRDLATREPNRCFVIPANLPPQDVLDKAFNEALSRIGHADQSRG